MMRLFNLVLGMLRIGSALEKRQWNGDIEGEVAPRNCCCCAEGRGLQSLKALRS